MVALALVMVAVLAFLRFRASKPSASTETAMPVPQATDSGQPPAPFAGSPAPETSAVRASGPSLPVRPPKRVELPSLALAMDAPAGFEPRVSGSGVILCPPGPLRLQTTLIAVHPAGVVEDPSVYSQVANLANGATLKYRAVDRPEAEPPAIELQGLMDAFGASYFVSCRDASAERPLAAEWCVPFLASLEKR